MGEQSLKQKTAGAVLWNLADRMGQQILVFVVGIIVANILSVTDYALIGMLAIFSTLASIVLESGFSSALIRKQDATESHYNSVFYFNVGMSFFLYAILFISAPAIAHFFEQPLLIDLSRIVFLVLPFNSLSLIQTTLLNKQVKFGTLAKINLGALIISSMASLFMAWSSWGVWTLAWQPVILAASRSLLLWIFGEWRPQLIFRTNSIRELFGFASGLLLASILNSVVSNIYSVAIGKFYPTQQMGLYTQGNKFSLMMITAIYSSVQTATYPIFSSIQEDRDRSLRSYRKTMRFTSFLTFPVLLGLVAVAQPFFALILKPEWSGCVPFFQLTCLAGIFTILGAINQNFAKVYGCSGLIFRLEIVRAILVFVCLFFTLRESALVMIACQAILQGIIYLISIILIGQKVGYHWWLQIKDIAPYAMFSVIMWLLLQLTPYCITSDYLLLPINIVLGASFYYVINRLFGSTILIEVRNLLFRRNN